MLFRGSTVKTFGLRQMNAGKEKGPQLLDKLLLKQLEAPGHVLVLWLEGIWRPLSAPVRWLLFCRLCPAPGCWLSHEYPVTQTKLAMKPCQGFELCLSLRPDSRPHLEKAPVGAVLVNHQSCCDLRCVCGEKHGGESFTKFWKKNLNDQNRTLYPLPPAPPPSS